MVARYREIMFVNRLCIVPYPTIPVEVGGVIHLPLPCVAVESDQTILFMDVLHYNFVFNDVCCAISVKEQPAGREITEFFWLCHLVKE